MFSNLYEYTTNPFDQQKEFFKTMDNLIIFDVGAYTGTIVNKYNTLFPTSVIHAFEPSHESFTKLQKNYENHQNINLHPIALGKDSGMAFLHINEYMPTNSLLSSHKNASYYWGDKLLDTNRTEKISIYTIDQFCKTNNIPKIDILKLDTQGTEYDVLKGACSMLAQKKISLIYMEIILVDTYIGQKTFPEITDLLADYGYRLFNIYNPLMSKKMELNQIDVIFLPSKGNV